MAELENQVEDTEEVETTVEETTENQEDYEDNQEDYEDNQDAWEDITYEQAMKWKEDLRKASRKIAELKKQNPKKKEVKTQNTNQDLELRLFFIENPEFKENKEWILEVLSQEEYKKLTPQEALAIYNLKKPKESKTIINSVGGSYKPKPKQLQNLKDEEAINLSPSDYVKYLKAKWELK